MKFRTAKVIVFSVEEFRQKLLEFWGEFIQNNSDALSEDGNGKVCIPESIFKIGIKNMDAFDLFSIGQVYVDVMFDQYSYQILTVMLIGKDGKVFTFDPHLNENDCKEFLRDAEIEDLEMDDEKSQKKP